MATNLLSVKDVAKLLDMSVQRVYQLDATLQPIYFQRGSKMRSRLYRPEHIEAVRVARGVVAIAQPVDEVTQLRAAMRELRLIAIEGFSRGWDKLDAAERINRINVLART